MNQNRTAAPKAEASKGPVPEFAVGEYAVHPAHGVGTVTEKGPMTVGGYELDVLTLAFPHSKSKVIVPMAKVASVRLRRVSSVADCAKALKVLGDRPKANRVMWSRKAQDTEAKINSGDLVAIAEAMRDMHKPDGDGEPSYSQRCLYESARDRLVGEVAVAHDVTVDMALGMVAKASWVPAKGSKPAAVAADEDEDVAA